MSRSKISLTFDEEKMLEAVKEREMKDKQSNLQRAQILRS